jgi:vitamin B12 transporter
MQHRDRVAAPAESRKLSATATWLPIDPLTLSATVLHVSDWLDVSRDGMTSAIVAPGYTVINLRGDYAIFERGQAVRAGR